MFQNCIIANNSASFYGGALHAISSSSTLRNCTVVYNNATSGGGIYALHPASRPTVHNSILWGNRPQQITSFRDAVVAVTYSDVQGSWPGEGNVNTNPRLTRGTFRLKGYSPCIDAGSDLDAPPTDIDDEARWDHPARPNQISIVDMGAAEFVDTDRDGLPDAWEGQIVGAKAADGIDTIRAVLRNDDFDADGLTNWREFLMGTDPTQADTDGDGLTDGAEVALSTNPHIFDPDSEGDEWPDFVEVDPHDASPTRQLRYRRVDRAEVIRGR